MVDLPLPDDPTRATRLPGRITSDNRLISGSSIVRLKPKVTLRNSIRPESRRGGSPRAGLVKAGKGSIAGAAVVPGSAVAAGADAEPAAGAARAASNTGSIACCSTSSSRVSSAWSVCTLEPNPTRSPNGRLNWVSSVWNATSAPTLMIPSITWPPPKPSTAAVVASERSGGSTTRTPATTVTRWEALVTRAWLPVRRTNASCSDAPALSVSMIWTACIMDPASRPPK